MSRIGLHVKTGSRNGYGLVCTAKPGVVFSVGEGGALIEAKEKSGGHAWTFFRDIRYYGDNPHLDNLSIPQAIDAAKRLYPLLAEQWRKNPADAYAGLNEPAANDTEKMPVYNAYEMTLMDLAAQDDLRMIIGNLFSGTPDDGSVAGEAPNGGMETWKTHYADHIARAFELGHFYGRHCYGFPDLFPLDYNSDRPLREAHWLESEGIIGGIVVSELGLRGGMVRIPTDHMIDQMAQWDAWILGDPIGKKLIAGGCWWTYGDWHDVNIENSSAAIVDHLIKNPSARWEWPEDENGGEQPGDLEQYLWRRSIEIQESQGIHLNRESELETAIRADGLAPVTNESTEQVPGDPESYVIRAGEDLEYSKPRKVYVWQPGKEVWSFEEPGVVIPPIEPPGTHHVDFGLHARADGGILPEEEFKEFQDCRPDIIKILSSTAESGQHPHVSRLSAEHPGALFIVRAFLDFGGRNITPAQFFTDTFSDVQRSVNAISNYGNEAWIELHNEPNLTSEGWGTSWASGSSFNSWLLDVLRLYRSALPSYKYLYPGLSPGPGASSRSPFLAWIEDSREAAEVCDGLGVHAYWNSIPDPYDMKTALADADAIIAKFPNSPIFLTESSNNKEDTAANKAQQYIEFWNHLKARPTVRGVTYFVASASNPAYGTETWVDKGIGAMVADR
jgi:hypothetical protein